MSLSPAAEATVALSTQPRSPSSQTQVLPGAKRSASLPAPGKYHLRPDRCVIEVSAGPLRLLWARLGPSAGEFEVLSDTENSSLWMRFGTGLRPRPALLGRGVFDPGESRIITYNAQQLVWQPPNLVALLGEIKLSEHTQALDLHSRIVHASDDCVVLHAHGVLRPLPQASRPPRLLNGRRHITVAVEFAR